MSDSKFFEIKRLLKIPSPQGLVTVPGPFFLTAPTYLTKVDHEWHVFSVHDLSKAADTLHYLLINRSPSAVCAEVMGREGSGFTEHKNSADTVPACSAWELHACIGKKLLEVCKKAARILGGEVAAVVNEKLSIAEELTANNTCSAYAVATSLAFCSAWCDKGAMCVQTEGGADFSNLDVRMQGLMSLDGFCENMPRMCREAKIADREGATAVCDIRPIDRYAYSLISPTPFSIQEDPSIQKQMFAASARRSKDNTPNTEAKRRIPGLTHCLLRQEGVAHRVVTAVLSPESAGIIDTVTAYTNTDVAPPVSWKRGEGELGEILQKHCQSVCVILESGEFGIHDILQRPILPISRATENPYWSSLFTNLPQNTCPDSLVYGRHHNPYHIVIDGYNAEVPALNSKFPPWDNWGAGDRVV